MGAREGGARDNLWERARPAQVPGGGPLTADCSLDGQADWVPISRRYESNLKWVSRCVNEATASGEPTLEPTLPLAHPIPAPLPSRDCAKSDRPTHTSTRWCGACFVAPPQRVHTHL